MKKRNIQSAQQKNPRQRRLLLLPNLQPPNHRQRQTQNQQINQQISYPIPPKKRSLVYARPAQYGFIPIERNGFAFKGGDEDTDNKKGCDDDFCGDEDVAEPGDDAEDAVVEEDEGGFEGDGGGEVEDLQGEEGLLHCMDWVSTELV